MTLNTMQKYVEIVSSTRKILMELKNTMITAVARFDREIVEWNESKSESVEFKNLRNHF